MRQNLVVMCIEKYALKDIYLTYFFLSPYLHMRTDYNKLIVK